MIDDKNINVIDVMFGDLWY